jgi:hypothetical protein
LVTDCSNPESLCDPEEKVEPWVAIYLTEKQHKLPRERFGNLAHTMSEFKLSLRQLNKFIM